MNQVENLSEEWQYLFREAGVTEGMLRDKASLQFILDTVFEMGGAPQKVAPTESKGVRLVSQTCAVLK